MQLQDKVIIVTGGGQGLGRAMAEYLAAKGVKLALVDLDQEKLDAAVAACESAGTQARAYLCNVANEEQVAHMVAQVAADFGAINGLINNAGILRDGLTIRVKDGEMTKMSLANWQAVIDVNLTGVFLCTREVAAKMIELKNQGAIVNISSISRAGNMGQANYSRLWQKLRRLFLCSVWVSRRRLRIRWLIFLRMTILPVVFLSWTVVCACKRLR